MFWTCYFIFKKRYLNLPGGGPGGNLIPSLGGRPGGGPGGSPGLPGGGPGGSLIPSGGGTPGRSGGGLNIICVKARAGTDGSPGG